MSKNMIQNGIRTPDGTELFSRHRHDYIEYTDKNGKTYIIDGGLDYCRTTVHDDQVSLILYDDEPHEVQREVVVWGTYGISGREPLRYVPVKDMETTHIERVLNICSPCAVIRECMKLELEMRKTL
jgi:hypothetical protein